MHKKRKNTVISTFKCGCLLEKNNSNFTKYLYLWYYTSIIYETVTSFSLDIYSIAKYKIQVNTLSIDFEMGVHICDKFVNNF